MINASVDFRRTMTERTDFRPYVKITFADGRTVNLADNDFSISNNGLTDGAESNSFPLGAAICRSFQMEIKNYDQKFKDYNFYKAVLQLQLYFQLNTGKPEIINFGQFTITTPEAYGTVITVQAVDNMYKANASYTTNLTFPCTLLEVVRDCCKQCNLPLKTAAFNNNNFIVKNKPENISFREVLAQAAMIAGGYARIDRSGYLQIVTYDLSVFEKEGLGDGGTFEGSEESTVYVDGDQLDGGTFNPWNTGAVLDSGQFTSMDNYHVLYDFMSDPQIDADDIVITGIQMADTDGTVKLCGKEGYVLNIENQLAKGNEQDAVNRIGKLVNGFKFRAFSGEYIGYPLAEFGDVCYIRDQSGNVYQSILTDVTFRFYGKTSFKCSADSPLRNSSKSAYNSDYVKAVIAARNYMEQELSVYDLAVQQMNQLAANTLGFYQTAVKQEDGSLIVYRHDKPKLAESKIVYKSGIDGFFVTRNYTGKDSTTSWKNGFDSSGNAALNILSVIGIHWDWASGGTLTLGGKGNGNGLLQLLNSGGTKIMELSNGGQILYDTAGLASAVLQYDRLFFFGDAKKITGSKQNVTGICFWKKGIAEFKGTIYKDNNNNIIFDPEVIPVTDEDTGEEVYEPLSFSDGLTGIFKRIKADKIEGNIYGSDFYGKNTFNETSEFKAVQKFRNSLQVYNAGTTTAGWTACIDQGNYKLTTKSSSSMRYKDVGELISEQDITDWYNIRPVWAKYKEGYLSENDEREGIEFPMFIAEDVEKYMPLAVDHLPDGRAETWNERIMIPAMFAMLKSQKQEIEDLRKLIQGGRDGNTDKKRTV